MDQTRINIQFDSVSSGFLRFPKCKTDSSVSFTEVSRSQETWEALSELKFTQGKVYLLFQDWGGCVCACLANKTIPVSALPAVRAI